MPEYQVSIRYSIVYTAIKIVSAKNESAAQAKVEKGVESVGSLAGLEKYIGSDSDIDIEEENLEVEDVSEI